jgi:hypothetical protein
LDPAWAGPPDPDVAVFGAGGRFDFHFPPPPGSSATPSSAAAAAARVYDVALGPATDGWTEAGRPADPGRLEAALRDARWVLVLGGRRGRAAAAAARAGGGSLGMAALLKSPAVARGYGPGAGPLTGGTLVWVWGAGFAEAPAVPRACLWSCPAAAAAAVGWGLPGPEGSGWRGVLVDQVGVILLYRPRCIP